MSKLSDELEYDLTKMINMHSGEHLPNNLPYWMLQEGIVPGSTILCAEGIGSKSKENKTDVIIYLHNSIPIKISAKLLNADYFGNWYGHNRFLKEFGTAAFNRMTKASALWANKWANTATNPFVGVSICFGKRTGNTAQRFTDIFTEDDILTVAKGFGTGNHVANCMYISNTPALNIQGLINSLEPITKVNVIRATSGFMIAHRPINPMTEGSNRGKNVYCRFAPYYRLPTKTTITNAKQLFSLGEFITVNSDCTNHNHILNDLEHNFNIKIPRK
ncbi:MAG: hypothetical protein LBS02_17130 [Hungatella sp.]|jgi:hypothetical protein|nr:hypothetical protein [Hungatella sp.]